MALSVVNNWTRTFDDCLSSCSGTMNLVAIPADQDCVIVPDLSQVSDLYIVPNGAQVPFDFSGGDPTAVLSAIDNSDAANLYTKWLVGKGGVDDPEQTTYNGPKGRRVITQRRYKLTFEVVVADNTVRNLLLQLQCNWLGFTFFYATRGGWLYGGSVGIEPNFVNAFLPLGAGDEDNEVGRIEIDWDAKKGDPNRHPNPLA